MEGLLRTLRSSLWLRVCYVLGALTVRIFAVSVFLQGGYLHVMATDIFVDEIN